MNAAKLDAAIDRAAVLTVSADRRQRRRAWYIVAKIERAHALELGAQGKAPAAVLAFAHARVCIRRAGQQ